MTTNCDDVARYLENNYDDLKGKVLTIHTNKAVKLLRMKTLQKPKMSYKN